MTHDPERFQDGEQHAFGGIRFRIRPGTKEWNDHVLDWWVDGRWREVPCVAFFFFIDFIAWNEDNLAERRPGWKGGQYLVSAMQQARLHGWRVASAKLDEQRARRNDPEAYL